MDLSESLSRVCVYCRAEIAPGEDEILQMANAVFAHAGCVRAWAPPAGRSRSRQAALVRAQ